MWWPRISIQHIMDRPLQAKPYPSSRYWLKDHPAKLPNPRHLDHTDAQSTISADLSTPLRRHRNHIHNRKLASYRFPTPSTSIPTPQKGKKHMAVLRIEPRVFRGANAGIFLARRRTPEYSTKPLHHTAASCNRLFPDPWK